jgi:hypothetical protein
MPSDDSAFQAITNELANGYVMTLAGNGSGGYADGTNSAARFFGPAGLAVELDGSLVIADARNHRLRRLTFSAPPEEPRLGELRIELKPWLTLRGEIGQTFRIEISPLS